MTDILQDRTKQIKVVAPNSQVPNDPNVLFEGIFVSPGTEVTLAATEEQTYTTLFEGLSNETKTELKAKWGENIIVYYQQLYTTISAGQTYSDALSEEGKANNVSKQAYTEEEFLTYAAECGFDPILWAYNQKNLDKKLGTKTPSSSKKTTNSSKKVSTYVSSSTNTSPNIAAYLFTSLGDLKGAEEFPLSGLTKEQVTAARFSLEEEDAALSEYATENNLSINDSAVKAQQIEAVIFLVGTVTALDTWIKLTGVKWIGGADRKGLIKNTVNSVTKQQVIMLIIDVRLKANKTVLSLLGY